LKPLVEIVLATHNGEKYLEEQLDSLLGQSYNNILITIRDDNSSDNTRNILKNYKSLYPKTIRLFWNDSEAEGPIENFSTLISIAKASYIMLCDQDDVWFPDKVSVSAKRIFELEKKYGKNYPLLVHTDLEVVDSNLDKKFESFLDFSKLNPENVRLNNLLVQNVITGCTLIINQSLRDNCIPIPKEAAMHDWWISLVAMVIGKIDFIPSQTIMYRQHVKNILGAKPGKLTITTFIKKTSQILFTRKGINDWDMYFKQAKALINSIGEKIPDEKKLILLEFVQLRNHNFLLRRYKLVTKGYLKQDLIKSLGLLIWI